MVNYNPNALEVVGDEAMLTVDQKARVWAGAPARMFRAPPSTLAETIGSLKLSASVNPLARNSIPTLIDVIPEGSEFVPLPTIAQLVPNSDNVNTGWTDAGGGTTNLFSQLDEATDQWPGPASVGEIKAITPGVEYACGVDASLFNGGAAANGRIFYVGVGAILACNTPTTMRKMSVKLLIDGNVYEPAAGGLRDVHWFGEIYSFFWGEINPATNLPWTPSDIAQFDLQADWGIRVRTDASATASAYPRVLALSLNVAYQNTENRVAVGVWRRPENIGTQRLITVTTDALRSMPSGAANWSKPASGSFLYYWRQASAPAVYGPSVADDVRWNGAYQNLGPAGHPAGIVYPLTNSGASPPPAGVVASQAIAHDVYGRPQEPFTGTSRAAYGLVLRTTAPADSVDSWIYRMDLADLVSFKQGSGLTGQRFVTTSGITFVAVRFPIIPPATGNPTLTFTINRVSDNAQMGGSLVMTADDVRKIAPGPAGLRFVDGLLSAPAALSTPDTYDMRLTSTGTTDAWIGYAPDCSIAPTLGFGGTTAGALIAGSHVTTRDFAINVMRQPNPPTGVTAAIQNVAINVPYVAAQVPTRQSVNLTWSPPVSGMGANFYRYEVERRLDGGTWYRVAHLYQSAAASWPDREAPRATLAEYRVRAVGKDGKLTAWAQTGAGVTPQTSGMLMIMTSNHNTGLEVCYFYDKESTFLVLSNARDEEVLIAGSDDSVVFMEREDRGIGWGVNIWVNQAMLVGKGGTNILTPLLNLIRPAADGSLPVPYVCVMDQFGSQTMGHVSVEEVPQIQPQHRYTAQLTVKPTNSVPVPVEIP